MKLDPRIEKISDILTCFDEEKAEQFLDKKGYFTQHIGDFHRLKNCKYGELVAIVDDPYYPYASKPDGDNIDTYSFFLPEIYVEIDEVNALKNKVKELEGKVIELQNKLNLGTANNPFTPFSNCCARIDYPNGFNPQSNWCK